MESPVSSTRKRLLCLCFFLTIPPVVFISYWWGGFPSPWWGFPVPFIHSIFHTNSSRNGSLNGTSTPAPRNVTILLWYWPFGESDSLDGDLCWDLYGIPNCRVVDQRSMFPKADVVVFHNRELVNGQQSLPHSLPRPPGQKWAWFSLESPENNWNMKPLANKFNLTMSYRRDADIFTPYGMALPKKPDDKEKEAVVPNKTTLACWVVSNYSPRHRRTQVYKELITVVPVDVYGRWTGRPLANENLASTISRCYFYLSFENTISKDYITEKLWRNAYGSGAVPVVLGASLDDYKAVAPPHSFIHVDEFASVKALGEHLKELAKDKERYEAYLAWRHSWKIKNFQWREMLCRACSQFDHLPREKVYTDLDGWVRD